MINILFDHQKFSTQKYGGISRYFANLMNEIENDSAFTYKLGVLASRNNYLNTKKLLLNKFGSLMSEVSRAEKVNQLYCRYLIERADFDVFHPTYYDPYWVGKIKKPVVITIHDMTHECLPEYFWALDPLSSHKRLNIEHADKIIAISETTKKDLIRHSDVDPSKISVVYHGIDFNQPLRIKPVEGLPENYLLFVGDRGGYKNFYLFMKAFKELSLIFPDIQVVLTGGGSLGIADLEFIKRLKIDNKVTHLHVDDEQLNYLYQKALALIYPSLQEGFGLPILEAFNVGCPLILSDIECFHEIAGDSALFFERLSIDSLTQAMERMITDTELRSNLILKGSQRLLNFPLERSVRQTLEIYRAMI